MPCQLFTAFFSSPSLAGPRLPHTPGVGWGKLCTEHTTLVNKYTVTAGESIAIGPLMERIKQFQRNAGTMGALQTLAVIAFIFLFAVPRDIVTGQWIITVPILAVVLTVPYFARDFLVYNFNWLSWVMNACAVTGIIIAFLNRGQAQPEPLWLRATLAGCIGLYIGCYFWMLSDPRLFLTRVK
jgi:hypothetical protein